MVSPNLEIPKATPVAGLYPLLPNIGRFLSGCEKTAVKLFFGALLGMKVYSTALEQCAVNTTGCWKNTRMCAVCRLTAAAIPILYIFPNSIKNTDTPCLGRINPIDPATTKAYTKHQIYGSKSNAPLNFQVRGKDKLDIWNHKKDLAASSIIALMKQNGLIQSESTTDLNDDSSNSDLSVLAKNFQGMFFMLHRSEWGFVQWQNTLVSMKSWRQS